MNFSERKHFTPSEMEKIFEAIKGAIHEIRDRCLLLLIYRHGLRVSEACGLKMHQVSLADGVLHVHRLKGGLSTTHPLRADEERALKAWFAQRARMAPACDEVFVSNRRTPINRRTVWVMLVKYGKKAGLSLDAHPHMLRHSCGYALADRGADTRLIQDYLGHRNIQHTVRYTATNPARFEKLWR